MLIRSKKTWELPESAATPEAVYRDRRSFLKAAGMGAAGALLGTGGAAAATAGFPTKLNPRYAGTGLKPTSYELVTSYNNFYEFSTTKEAPKRLANQGWKTDPWTVEIGGLVNNPLKLDVDDLVKKVGGIEQRIYRFRCVEAWSAVIPWDGFPLAKLVDLAQPKRQAKFVKFTTFLDPKSAPGQRSRSIDWPYVEGLTLAEATNDLALVATGLYGKPLPNQNGAPIRLVVPWKYGFKSIKSIVKIEFVEREPLNTWQAMIPDEYGFYANVNPAVDHPRWSQASERVLGSGFFGGRVKTLPFNGYEKEVAHLYKGMDLRKYY